MGLVLLINNNPIFHLLSHEYKHCRERLILRMRLVMRKQGGCAEVKENSQDARAAQVVLGDGTFGVACRYD
jgi:hypothetical protein